MIGIPALPASAGQGDAYSRGGPRCSLLMSSGMGDRPAMDLCSVLPCTHGSCAIFRLQKNRKRLVAQRGLSCASAMKKRDGCFKPASPCPSPRLPAQPASHAAACRRARGACPGCPDQPADLLDGGAWSMASRRCPFESLSGFSANAAVAAPGACPMQPGNRAARLERSIGLSRHRQFPDALASLRWGCIPCPAGVPV